MRFLERSFLLMYLLGIYFVFFQKKADYSLIFVSAAVFSVFYILCMPFLLSEISFKDIFTKAARQTIEWQHLVAGFLFGVLNAYMIFSITYHMLRQMDSVALVENCGLFLVPFIAGSIWIYKKKKHVFYKNMLFRSVIWCAIIITSVSMPQIIHLQ